jgi:hypothetical protein
MSLLKKLQQEIAMNPMNLLGRKLTVKSEPMETPEGNIIEISETITDEKIDDTDMSGACGTNDR